LIKQRLVSMLADLTAMQLSCRQLAGVADAGQLTAAIRASALAMP